MITPVEHLFPILFAVAVHELGHIFVMLALGIKLNTCKSRFWGIKITADFSGSSYAKELAVILAGSGANLLFAFLLRDLDGYAYAALSYGMFNLLPAHFLDGGEAFRLFLLMHGVQPASVRAIIRGFTLAVTVAMWIVSVYFALKGFGEALLITVLYMMVSCFFDKNY